MQTSLRILIAEDHAMYREGLRMLVRELEGQVEILEAENLSSALALAEEQGTDLNLILLDIQLPGSKGLSSVQSFRKQFPLIPIVVISMLEMDANIQHVMKLGVNGFIAKSSSHQQMLKGLTQVLNGESVIIRDGFSDNHDADNNELSPRQLETLRLMAEGQSNKEIARSLGISDTTVREYVSEILNRLNASNRIQAINTARSAGIIID